MRATELQVPGAEGPAPLNLGSHLNRLEFKSVNGARQPQDHVGRDIQDSSEPLKNLAAYSFCINSCFDLCGFTVSNVRTRTRQEIIIPNNYVWAPFWSGIKMIEDRKFRKPRIWSNNQLRAIAHLFKGKVINVSGWQDSDKQESRYRDYFINASEYWISNYRSEARGYQGDLENEIFLDLEEFLADDLRQKFDVVFNHTVLEHIYDFRKAFSNLCELSKDIVIVVVPFLQEQHADYGDYWRFTPLALKRLYEDNGFEIMYLNFNDNSRDSIYIFAVGARKVEGWAEFRGMADNQVGGIDRRMIGTKVIRNNAVYHASRILRRILARLRSRP